MSLGKTPVPRLPPKLSLAGYPEKNIIYTRGEKCSVPLLSSGWQPWTPWRAGQAAGAVRPPKPPLVLAISPPNPVQRVRALCKPHIPTRELLGKSKAQLRKPFVLNKPHTVRGRPFNRKEKSIKTVVPVTFGKTRKFGRVACVPGQGSSQPERLLARRPDGGGTVGHLPRSGRGARRVSPGRCERRDLLSRECGPREEEEAGGAPRGPHGTEGD